MTQRRTPESAARQYATRREREGAMQRLGSRAARDIGTIPLPADPGRRRESCASLRLFCENYFPLTFHLAWSADHLKVLAQAERAILHGGLFALAMPRHTGKTSICECACVWAILAGHQNFVCLIGASEAHAAEMLDSVRRELDGNDLLLEDFPEAVFPIRALDGIANRCKGQLYCGERTHVAWTAEEIVLPTIKPQGPEWAEWTAPDGYSISAGAILRVAGITGRIRGMKYKRADGKTARPSLVILDDPQTDESAQSLSQCATRERIIAGAVLGLAGPGQKIAGLMPCTVIRPGDVADNILNRKKHPEWNGERTKMIYAFPTNTKLWDRYAEIRGDSLRQHGDLRDATAFYEEHRSAMDEGANVAWPEDYETGEASAIQHAINLKLNDEVAFFAEYQNDPVPLKGAHDEGLMTADQIAGKLNGMERSLIPIECSHITMFVDIQQKALFYVVAAWSQDFTGYVIDYGTYPDQGRSYFTLREIQRTLQVVERGVGMEGAIYAGLEKLVSDYAAREWRRDDGAGLRIGMCLIDANWGESTDTVYQFARQTSHASVVMPSHGRYVGAGSRPMHEWSRKPGDRVGLNWRVPTIQGQKRAVRHVVFDANHWKSFVHARLGIAMGDRGCLSLFGRDPGVHRLFAEHLTAEYRVRTQGRGRVVDEWKTRPNTPENHWLDGLVGCAVGASMLGVTAHGTASGDPMVKPRKRYTQENLRHGGRRA